MAKVIKGDLVRKNGSGPTPKYPWDEWFDGRQWELRNGEDFTRKDASQFRQSILLAAKKLGITVMTSVIDDSTVRLQARMK